MKKNFCLSTIFFSAVFLVSISGCKKETQSALEKYTGMLTSGNWKLTYYWVYSVTGDYDAYATLPACRKDDFVHFNSDGTKITDEGSTKCNSADPQTTSTSWRFTNDNANRIDLNGTEYIIDALTNDEFRIHTANTDPYATERVMKYTH